MAKLALCLLSLFMLFSLAAAGTVTLSGGCTPTNTVTNVTTFSITNSGNDTPVQMVITPVIVNAHPANAFYNIGALGPSSTARINVSVTNMISRGTSGAYFIAAYQQGGSLFTAVFPCLVDFGVKTSSQMVLTSNANVSLNGNATVLVHEYNAGQSAANTIVFLATPSSFLYRSPRSVQLNVSPGETLDAKFYLQIPTQVQSSYTVGAISTYLQGNLTHTTLTVTVLSPKIAKSSLGPVAFYGAVVVVLLILVLIAASVLRKKGEPQAPQV